MGKPAARISDMAAHGGAITYGTPKVFIGGLPAARVGDPVACPGFTGPVPHVVGNITQGSTSVMIFGAFAARQGDLTGCGLLGKTGFTLASILGPFYNVESGQSDPKVVGQRDPVTSYKKTVEDKKKFKIHSRFGDFTKVRSSGIGYKSESGYENKNGFQEVRKVSAIHEESETTGPMGLTIKESKDIGVANSEWHGGSKGVGSIGFSAGAAAEQESKSIGFGPFSASYERKAGAVSTDVDGLVGGDGDRTGFMIGGSGGYSISDVEVNVSSEYPLPFLNGQSAKVTFIGGVGKGEGVDAHIGVYHSDSDDRDHFRFVLDLPEITGGKKGFDFSLGRISPQLKSFLSTMIPIPCTPGTIITGLPTVLIG